MPSYDFRCKQCGRPFSQFYKSVKDYEAGTRLTCPHCGSANVARRIRRVAIPRPSRDLSRLSPNEMLSVMNSDNPREVGTMFQQVIESAGGDLGDMGSTIQEATDRLLRGESIDSVEGDLASRDSTPAADD
jgi:putative FmdB family regulatory protein